MQKLLDALENLDDVQEVFTNAALWTKILSYSFS
jgi:transcriptional/translational regulatory protein YebC/TACO1